MTPDDVVARAKDLVGQRVHLTVEGEVRVTVAHGEELPYFDLGLWSPLANCELASRVVSIVKVVDA